MALTTPNATAAKAAMDLLSAKPDDGGGDATHVLSLSASTVAEELSGSAPQGEHAALRSAGGDDLLVLCRSSRGYSVCRHADEPDLAWGMDSKSAAETFLEALQEWVADTGKRRRPRLAVVSSPRCPIER